MDRAYAEKAIEALPPDHRSLATPITPYEVKISAKLRKINKPSAPD